MFFEEKTAADEGSREKKDLALWNQWNDNGRQPEDLKPLFSQFRGKIRSKSKEWVGRVEIPPAAIKAEFNKQFVNAVKTYDPDRGPLGPWVGTNLRKGNRWLMKHQNFARIVETRSGKNVRHYKDAFSHLEEAFGREPTHIELAENLGWAPKEAEALGKELRKSLVASGSVIDPVDVMPSREKEVLHNVYYELAPQEQLVFDYTLGWHGKQELRPTQIAQKMGLNNSKISRIRKKIMDKISDNLR